MTPPTIFARVKRSLTRSSLEFERLPQWKKGEIGVSTPARVKRTLSPVNVIEANFCRNCRECIMFCHCDSPDPAYDASYDCLTIKTLFQKISSPKS